MVLKSSWWRSSAEGGVGQAPAEAAFAVGHAFDVEGLDRHHVERAGQGGGDGVEVQGPGLGDPAVEEGPAAEQLPVVLRPASGPGDRPVETAQTMQLGLEGFRVGDVPVGVGQAGDGN